MTFRTAARSAAAHPFGRACGGIRFSKDFLRLRAHFMRFIIILIVANRLVIFPAVARAETYGYQTTGKVAAAYGEWWDSTGTILSQVLSNVGAQIDHAAGGEQGHEIYGDAILIQHDYITGEDLFGMGLAKDAPAFRGDLSQASYGVDILMFRYDDTLAEYVAVGNVTINVSLEGFGPIAKSIYRTTDKEAANWNIHEDFMGSTRNALPRFAIDGAEVDAALFDFAAGYLSDGRANYKYTVNP